MLFDVSFEWDATPGRHRKTGTAYGGYASGKVVMILKLIVPMLGAALVNGPAIAADYRPAEFLKLDLSNAVLSPKRLGPEAYFMPLPIQAKADPGADAKSDQKSNQAVAAGQAEPRSDMPRNVATARVRVARPLARPHGPASTVLAHRHGNPLDAQAMDSRIQTWPCRPGSGGICGWK